MTLSDTITTLGNNIVSLIGTRANKDLSNLSTTGEEKLATVVLFDKSKFTIDGTPVITDDGVVSGLSSSNYITAISPDLWTNWDNWHIHFRVYCDFSYASYCYLGDFTYGYLQYNPGYHALVLQVYDTSNAQIWIAIENFNSKFSTGDIDVDIYYSSETGYYFTVTQGTKTYTSSKSSNKNKLRYATNKLIKFNSSSAGVNLKQFLVTVDGEEVISGSQTIYNALDKKIDINSDVVDGQWVAKNVAVASNIKTIGSYSYSLSDYLPNDGQIYEIFVRIYTSDTGTTSTTNAWCAVGDIENPYTNRSSCITPLLTVTDANAGLVVSSLPMIFKGRTLYLQIYGRELSTGTNITLTGYRRIGTNS